MILRVFFCKLLKGDKLRFEETGPDAENGAMIFDAKKKLMYSLRHDEKIRREISTDDRSKATQPVLGAIAVSKTGKSDQVAGYAGETAVSVSSVLRGGSGVLRCLGMMDAQAGGSSLLLGWMREMFKDAAFRSRAWMATIRGKKRHDGRP